MIAPATSPKAVDQRANFIEGDLADRQLLFRTLEHLRPEAVMHFAGNALVSESMQNPSKYFRNNVANGINLLEAAVQGRQRRPLDLVGLPPPQSERHGGGRDGQQQEQDRGRAPLLAAHRPPPSARCAPTRTRRLCVDRYTPSPIGRNRAQG